MTPPRVIEVVAALLTGADGRALMVRKHGTAPFMQPGGKIEPGEEALAALRRELVEELGLELGAERFAPLGTFTSAAANEPGFDLVAHVWRVHLHDEDVHVVAAEIAEARWVDAAVPDVPLAPLSEHELLPLLRREGS